MADSHDKVSSVDLFVLGLTMVSLGNIVWLLLPISEPITNVVLIVEAFLSILFLIDFLLRLVRTPAKSTYFLRQGGWIDLIGSLPVPGLRLARIFRVMRAYQPMRRMGLKGVWRQVLADLAGSTLLAAVLLGIVVLEYASMGILWAESGAEDANILTGADAVWWAYVTVATIGYGDRYPVTNVGRLVGVLLMTAGVGLFAVFTGFLANLFLSPKEAPLPPATLEDRVQHLENERARRSGEGSTLEP